jgi:DNA-binding transcriptional LysR family regulator
MPNYTLRQLKTFFEVAKLESVSKAAEKLFITQPAVSMQLRQLEDEFGIALFESVGRNIRLTNAGRDFMTQAAQVIASLKDLEAVMAEHVGMKRGQIDLGVVSTSKYFIPMLLVQFNKLFPNIDVTLHIDNKENIFGMVERNEVDLAISGRIPPELDYVGEVFASNPQAFVCAPTHPLSRKKNITFDMLSEHKMVVRERGSGTRAAMEKCFKDHNATMSVLMEMPSNETIKQAVMANMGLSFLSTRTLRHELASGHMVVMDVVDTPIQGQWQVVHLRNKKLSPTLKAFKQFLIEQGEALINAWA